ncbi:MAG TPA: hypothetical protein VKD72_07575, partial [Gemmataceae bacterium]|nr:hypothetical protein [Gemmataceae bacterium]
MAQVSPPSPRPPNPAPSPGGLPSVRLDVRTGTGTVTSYSVGETGFLLGTVPGCDLRLPGSNLPPVVALITRQPGGASVRKLAPIGGLLLNDQNVPHSPLRDGDQITLGPVEITVSITPSASVPVMRVRLYDGTGDASDQTPLPLPEAERGRDQTLREREERLASALAELRHRQESVEEERADLARQRHEITERTEQLAKQDEEVNRVRREMAELRQKLVAGYRQRRDRLAGLLESVRRAARRLQERKRRFEAELLQARTLREGDPQAELNALARNLTEKAQMLQEKQQQLQEREREFQAAMTRRLGECAAREQRL